MSQSTQASGGTPLPWVSMILVACCLYAALVARSDVVDATLRIDASLAEAETYFLEHPDLAPGPLLTERMGEQRIRQARRAFEAALRESGATVVSGGVTRRRQATLEELLAPVAQARAGLPARRYGLRPDAPRVSALLSFALLQAGAAQLLVATLLVLLLGIQLEKALGRPVFAMTVLGSTIAAALGFLQLAPSGTPPMVGTTGTIAGLLAVCLARDWRGNSRGGQALVMGFATAAIVGPPLLDAGWLLAPADGRTPAVGVGPILGALLGGVSGGLACYFVARAAGLIRTPAAIASAADPRVRRALDAWQRGRGEKAFEALARVVRERPGDMDAAAALWDVAGDLGRRAEVRSAMLRVVREEIRCGRQDAAAAHWLELAVEGIPEEAEPALLIRMATELARVRRPDAAVEALKQALAKAGAARGPAVASRVARVASGLDPATAEQAAWLALGSPEIDLAERQTLEAILAEVVEPVSVWAKRRAGGAGAEGAAVQQAPIDLVLDERSAEVLSAVPVALTDDQLMLRLKRGGERGLAYRRVEAIAVSAIQDLGPRPVVLVDLVLNWMSTAGETLRVVRLRSDAYDPRSLVPGDAAPEDAMRQLLKLLLDRSAALPLPDEASALGLPFVVYETLEAYQRTVLMVESLASDAPIAKQD